MSLVPELGSRVSDGFGLEMFRLATGECNESRGKQIVRNR
jgi:hypothetical protein